MSDFEFGELEEIISATADKAEVNHAQMFIAAEDFLNSDDARILLSELFINAVLNPDECLVAFRHLARSLAEQRAEEIQSENQANSPDDVSPMDEVDDDVALGWLHMVESVRSGK